MLRVSLLTFHRFSPPLLFFFVALSYRSRFLPFILRYPLPLLPLPFFFTTFWRYLRLQPPWSPLHLSEGNYTTAFRQLGVPSLLQLDRSLRCNYADTSCPLAQSNRYGK